MLEIITKSGGGGVRVLIVLGDMIPMRKIICPRNRRKSILYGKFETTILFLRSKLSEV